MISLKTGRKSIFANIGVATMTSLYGSFCINCDDETMKDFLGIIGNKAKNLYELKNIKGINIPEWFVVTSETFDQYVKDNEDIADLIEKFYDLQEIVFSYLCDQKPHQLSSLGKMMYYLI